jgi:hypothetical protein
MSNVRTTVTLDSDVVEQLKDLARRRNISFDAALNTAARAGLAAQHGENTPFRVDARPMGLRPNIDITHALRLAADLEDEEIIRKLQLGK